MSKIGTRNSRIILHVCLFCCAALFTKSTYGQNDKDDSRAGVPHDWSHHHLIFSSAGDPAEASKVGQEPRYWHQYHQRHPAMHDRGTGNHDKDEWQADEDRDRSRGDRKERNEGKGNNSLAPSLHRDWSMDMGSGATIGERTYPAKFSFDTSSANCGTATTPDFVVYNTGLTNSSTQAGIVAYDNLYSGCGGTVPSVYWAYNLQFGGPTPITTSVVLSMDGSQVAFVQNSSTLSATVMLLKWKKNDGTVTSPTAPIFAGSLLYRSCTAPCFTPIDVSFAGDTPYPSTFSAPFYDYSTDTLYVGNDGGYVYKITGAFEGTPTSAPFAHTASADQLTSPVLDHVSGNLFVGGRTSGPLYSISPAGVVTASGQIGTAAGHGIGDAPILDEVAGKVYAFVAQDAGGTAGGVFQFPTNFSAGSLGTEAVLGSANTSVSGAFDGAFDDSYYTSSTGYLYTCGYVGANPTLFRVSINSGVMGTVQQGPLLGTGGSCSPVTEIINGTTDRIFLSVQGAGSSFACNGGGCALSLAVTQWKPNTSYAINSEVLDSNFNVQIEENFPGGTSGSSVPTWGTQYAQHDGFAAETPDNNVLWFNQGPLANFTTPWQASHAYPAFAEILDSNGFIQVALSAGTSGGSQPTWSDAPNGATSGDGTMIWIAVGPAPGFALPSFGGTSAIVIDNSVSTGTLPGASQIYYSPLSNQTCAGNGTTGSGSGGCAVQASQAGLQ